MSGGFWADLTWTCHVCGDERPDTRISVYKRTLDLGHGIPVQENVRYCNDRPAYVEGAKTYSHFKDAIDGR